MAVINVYQSSFGASPLCLIEVLGPA